MTWGYPKSFQSGCFRKGIKVARIKKEAMTLIELIFVIVVMGILAISAISKLSATRDDARASKAAMNLSMYINDIGVHFTSEGTLDLSYSNVNLANDGCFEVSKVNEESVLAATVGGGPAFCQKAHNVASGLIGTHIFGGTDISY